MEYKFKHIFSPNKIPEISRLGRLSRLYRMSCQRQSLVLYNIPRRFPYFYSHLPRPVPSENPGFCQVSSSHILGQVHERRRVLSFFILIVVTYAEVGTRNRPLVNASRFLVVVLRRGGHQKKPTVIASCFLIVVIRKGGHQKQSSVIPLRFFHRTQRWAPEKAVSYRITLSHRGPTQGWAPGTAVSYRIMLSHCCYT